MFLSTDDRVKELCVKKDYGLDYRVNCECCLYVDDDYRGLELEEDSRHLPCIATWLVIPRAHKSPLYMAALPARSSSDYAEVIARSAYTVSYTQTILPPRMAILSSATRALNSASQPPSVDNGRRTKDSLSSLPRTSFRFENLRAVYLAVERSLVLTFDLSSIFCGALVPPSNTADLLFLGPSQIRCSFVIRIERIQLFLCQK